MIRESCVDPDMPKELLTIIDNAQAQAWNEARASIRDTLLHRNQQDDDEFANYISMFRATAIVESKSL